MRRHATRAVRVCVQAFIYQINSSETHHRPHTSSALAGRRQARVTHVCAYMHAHVTALRQASAPVPLISPYSHTQTRTHTPTQAAGAPVTVSSESSPSECLRVCGERDHSHTARGGKGRKGKSVCGSRARRARRASLSLSCQTQIGWSSRALNATLRQACLEVLLHCVHLLLLLRRFTHRRAGRRGGCRSLLAAMVHLLAHASASTMPSRHRRRDRIGVLLGGGHLTCGDGGEGTHCLIEAFVAIASRLDYGKDGLTIDVAEITLCHGC